jgi:nucleotide-binding universal stress UspA family protein
VTSEVRRGDPVDEILAAIRDSKADLVIMTTHGRTGFGRCCSAPLPRAVLRHADVPVILMRQTEVQIASRGPWQPFR